MKSFSDIVLFKGDSPENKQDWGPNQPVVSKGKKRNNARRMENPTKYTVCDVTSNIITLFFVRVNLTTAHARKKREKERKGEESRKASKIDKT